MGVSKTFKHIQAHNVRWSLYRSLAAINPWWGRICWSRDLHETARQVVLRRARQENEIFVQSVNCSLWRNVLLLMRIVMYNNTVSDVPITWPAASPITVTSTSLSTCLTDNVRAAEVHMTAVRLTSDTGFCRTARYSLKDIHVSQPSTKGP